MKKNRLLFGFVTLFIAVVILFSCQKDEISVSSEDGFLKLKSGEYQTEDGYFTYSENPACVGDDIIITFDNLQGYNHGNFTMHVWGPGDLDWVNVNDQLTAPVNGAVTYTIVDAVEGSYKFRGDWNRTGGDGTSTGWIYTDSPDDDLVVEVCGCETELTGEVICDGYMRTVTYTYTPEADGYVVIQGGFTHNATNFVEDFDDDVFDMTINENSNAGVRSFAGWVEECQEYTITITWEYVQYNKKDVRLVEDGHVIDMWSAKLYDDTDPENIVLIREMVIDPMICGDELDGYEPIIEEGVEE